MREPHAARRHVAFFFIYWVQKLTTNFQGVARLPVRSLMKRDPSAGGLGLSTDAAGSLLTSAALGWYVKALFGPITDRLPLFGYRRKSWLVISLGVTSITWFVAASHGMNAFTLLATLLSINMAVAFSDVVCDGLMLDEARRREQAGWAAPGTGSRSLQGAQWLGATTAMLVATFVGGVLAQLHGFRIAAVISGVLPLLLIVVVVVLVREERVQWDWKEAGPGLTAIGLIALVSWLVLSLKGLPDEHPLASIEPLLSPLIVLGSVVLVVRVPGAFWIPLGLAALWNTSPFATDTQYFYAFVTQESDAIRAFVTQRPLVIESMTGLMAAVGMPVADPTDPRAFMDVFFGSVLGLAELLASLVGVVLFVVVSRSARTATLLYGCMAALGFRLAAFASVPLGMAHPNWLVACSFLGGLVSSYAGLCLLVYGASRTPHLHQASLFALFNGVANLSSMLGKERLGNHLYTWPSSPEAGLALVITVSVLHLVVLALLVAWLSRLGHFEPAVR